MHGVADHRPAPLPRLCGFLRAGGRGRRLPGGRRGAAGGRGADPPPRGHAPFRRKLFHDTAEYAGRAAAVAQCEASSAAPWLGAALGVVRLPDTLLNRARGYHGHSRGWIQHQYRLPGLEGGGVQNRSGRKRLQGHDAGAGCVSATRAKNERRCASRGHFEKKGGNTRLFVGILRKADLRRKAAHHDGGSHKVCCKLASKM